MKIKCPWLGCNGVINILKEIKVGKRNLFLPEEVPWSHTTIICPKCHNPVGEFEITPGYWITASRNDEGKLTINDVSAKKTVKLPKSVKKNKYKILNKYLKEWARHDD